MGELGLEVGEEDDEQGLLPQQQGGEQGRGRRCPGLVAALAGAGSGVHGVPSGSSDDT